MIINKVLQQKIGSISNLPTLPQLSMQLMNVVNDKTSSAADVTAIISQDISLSAKILRLANSAFYGIPRTVTNINSAVVILGMKVIQTLVLSLTVFDMFPTDNGKFDRKSFWRHCLECGFLARLLSERVMLKRIDPDDAFCAGLLHDIGKIVMEQYLHQDFQSALLYSSASRLPAVEAEQKKLSYTHSDVSQLLLREWELPAPLTQSIVLHHNPDEAEECREIVYLIHLADHVLYRQRQEKEEEIALPPLSDNCMNVLDLSDIDIVLALQQFGDEMAKMDVFYSFLERDN
ncbi:MAG: HDOD domain-containing protein [Chitinivibrionales bacterium]